MSITDDMWQLMRTQGEFTRSDMLGVGAADGSIRVFIAALMRGGFVERAACSDGADTVWRVVRDTPVTPIVKGRPRVARAAGECFQRTAYGRVWQSCRVLRRFTTAQLAATAECSVHSARRYVRFLSRCGYVRCTHAAKTGARDAFAEYLLARNPGPYPLRYDSRRRVVTDLNTGEEFNV